MTSRSRGGASISSYLAPISQIGSTVNKNSAGRMHEFSRANKHASRYGESHRNVQQRSPIRTTHGETNYKSSCVLSTRNANNNLSAHFSTKDYGLDE